MVSDTQLSAKTCESGVLINYMYSFSDSLNSTINSIKSEVKQSQNAQLKLSSAGSSLEVFRMNMSLLNSCGMTKYFLCKKTHVLFQNHIY